MSGSAEHSGWRRGVQQLAALSRWIVQHDVLPERDPLPTPASSTSVSPSWLTSFDPLPRTTRPEAPRRRIVSWLSSPETLPKPSPPHGPDEGSFIRWLLGTEGLPSPPTPFPTKEASTDEP